MQICRVVTSPDHDDIQAKADFLRTPQIHTAEGRRLGASETCEEVHKSGTLGKIRMGWEMVGSVSSEHKTFVEGTVLNRAANYWSSTLQTYQTTTPLLMDRKCSERYYWPSTGNCVKGVEAPELESGLKVPDKYLAEKKGGCDSFGTCTETFSAGGGVAKDFFMFVIVQDCDGSTLAWARSIARNQCDRPIFGLINFCKNQLNKGKSADEWVSTAVHEMMHALGFSSNLFAYFRNANGTPKFPRNADGSLQNEQQWHCGQDTYVSTFGKGGWRWTDLSPDIVRVFQERDINNCKCPLGGKPFEQACLVQSVDVRTPNCVFKMVTPKVVEKARDFFDCKDLEGPELENQPTAQCSFVGSHWEQRLFMQEIQASTTAITPAFVSEVSLALFEDSGWYKVDYNRADRLVKGLHWGYKQGCDFVRKKCVEGGKPTHAYWCTANDQDYGCSLDRTRVMSCNVGRYGSAPPELSYITEAAGLSVADYCPFRQVTITNRICTSSSSSFSPYSNGNYQREVLGTNSRCFESTLMDTRAGAAYDGLGCFQVVCSSDKTYYKVMIASSHTSSSTIELGTCNADGQLLSGPSLKGSVKCAAPGVMCPPALTHLDSATRSVDGTEIPREPWDFTVDDPKFRATVNLCKMNECMNNDTDTCVEVSPSDCEEDCLFLSPSTLKCTPEKPAQQLSGVTTLWQAPIAMALLCASLFLNL